MLMKIKTKLIFKGHCAIGQEREKEREKKKKIIKKEMKKHFQVYFMENS